MKRSELKDGTKIFVINTRNLVTSSVFATALTEHFFRHNLQFFERLSKKESREILKKGLRYNGEQGEFIDGFFEASSEQCSEYNRIYSDAKKWVLKNYPYLK